MLRQTQPTNPTPPTPANGKRCSEMWPKAFDGPRIDLAWHPSLAEVAQRVTAWHKSERGGLVLAGGYGCGKTSIARIVLHAVGGPLPMIDWSSGQAESIWTATFYSEPELLEDIRRSYKENGEGFIVSRCQRAKLLIYDDAGAGYVREESQRWYEDILWRILNDRGDKKTLITTNLTPPEFQARIGGRAWSRLREMLGPAENYVSMFDVPDFRGKDW
jgi:DNA replication protein DnaC